MNEWMDGLYGMKQKSNEKIKIAKMGHGVRTKEPRERKEIILETYHFCDGVVQSIVTKGSKSVKGNVFERIVQFLKQFLVNGFVTTTNSTVLQQTNKCTHSYTHTHVIWFINLPRRPCPCFRVRNTSVHAQEVPKFLL